MKRLISVLIGAIAAGVVGYFKSGGDIGGAALVGLAFAVPVAITAISLPGFNTLAPAVAIALLMAVFGPNGSAGLGDWAVLWICLTVAAVVTTIWTWISARRRRRT
jgi:hypothetical protein